MDENTYSATFGAGCFWGVENNFMQLDGVLETSVGYMGGKFKNPTYFDMLLEILPQLELLLQQNLLVMVQI